MSRPEIKVDFDSHREEVNRLTVSQLNAVADVILRLNSLDDQSFALLCDVLTTNFADLLRKAVEAPST